MAILVGAVLPQDRQRIATAGYTVIDQSPAGVALALKDGEVPITVIVDCKVLDLLNPDDHLAHVSTGQVIDVAQSLGIAIDEVVAARIAVRVSAHLSEAAEGEIEYALDALSNPKDLT